MPVVRRYERQNQIGNLPVVQKRAAATALSEGAGVEEARAEKFRAFGDSMGLASRIGIATYERMREEEVQASNQTALLEADNRLAEFENRILYDPNNGALTKKGKNAMGVPEEVTAAYEKEAGEIEAGLSNDEQRAAFFRLKSNRKQGVDLQVQRHTAGEVQAYRTQELEAKIVLGTDAAIRSAQSPEFIAVELGNVDAAIDGMSKAVGWSEEMVTAKKAAAHSKVHTGVIANLIAVGKDDEARAYFDASKGEIDGTEIDGIETKLREATDLGAAQKEADRILLEGGSRTEQREKAKAIKDPEQRQKALELIEHEHSVRDRERLQAERENLTDLYNRIDGGSRDLNAIMRTPAYQSIDSLGVRNQIRDYIAERIKGNPITTDIETKLDLFRMVRDEPEKFAQLNLLTYRMKLSDQDLEEMARVQVSITNGKTREAAKEITGLLSTEQILRNTMGDRYDPKSKESQDLLRALNAKAEEAQLRTGKKMLDSELQEQADYLYQDVVIKEGTWKVLIPWRGSIFYPTGAADRFSDVTKPVRDLTISDIPEKEQQSISNVLRQAGKTPTPDLVLREWVRAKQRIGQVRTPQ